MIFFTGSLAANIVLLGMPLPLCRLRSWVSEKTSSRQFGECKGRGTPLEDPSPTVLG